MKTKKTGGRNYQSKSKNLNEETELSLTLN